MAGEVVTEAVTTLAEEGGSFEWLWPPSEKSMPALIAFAIGNFSIVWFLFLSKGESKYTVKAREVKRERITQGMELLLNDVKEKDEKDPKKEARDTGLPEMSRVLSYLWDDVHETPTTSFGISEGNPDFLATKALLNRTMTVELKKAKMFTEQARKFEHDMRRKISAVPYTDFDPKVEEEKNEKWLEEHDTSRKELDEYLSAEVLDELVEGCEKVVKDMGAGFLEPSTVALIKECRALVKKLKRVSAGTMAKVLGIAGGALPMWFMSIIFHMIGVQFWTEIDKVVLTGRIATEAIGPDGKWDSSISARLAVQVAISGFFLMFTHGVSDLVLDAAKRRFSLSLKESFMETMMFQDYAYFARHGAGALQERLNTDVERVSESLLSLPKDFISTCLVILMKIAYASSYAPISTVCVALCPIPIIAEGNRQLTKYRGRQEERGRKIAEQATAGTMDVISNIDVVRAFAMEKEETVRYRRSLQLQTILVERTALVSCFTERCFFFLFIANLGLSSYACAAKVATGEMDKNQVVNFMINIGVFCFFEMQNIFRMLPQLTKVLLPLNRIVTHLSSESKIEPNPNDPQRCPIEVIAKKKEEVAELFEQFQDGKNFVTMATQRTINGTNGQVKFGAKLLMFVQPTGEEDPVQSVEDLKKKHAAAGLPLRITFSRFHVPDEFNGEIEFKDVLFNYPSDTRTKVLNGMSFKIPKGLKVGICGEAGCGKSSTFYCIQRLYDVDPAGGAVFIDGHDIRSYNIHFLRRKIGVVGQKSVLFKTTVRDNVAYGLKPFPTDEEIKATLIKAQAWDFIDAKPDKLLTMLTETGGGFSGGQMQRLTIARTLIRKPEVILLDEATASLDPVNERAVQDYLDKIMKGYTTISIAHRLTTIKNADKILVLSKGKVVEEGTHDELLAIPVEYDVNEHGKQIIKSGFYHHQWQTQFAEKGLTTDKLQQKIAQLEDEIVQHKTKIAHTKSNMGRWRAAVTTAGLLSGGISSFGSKKSLEAEPPKLDESSRVLSRVTSSGSSAHAVSLVRILSGGS
mmetsp:Transcript_148094/g.258357  ORF Transcript_148094/g.258357 Transcript_148094/m.258357 type:complete len:1030 (+) Transcript_148094:61-3150(+)